MSGNLTHLQPMVGPHANLGYLFRLAHQNFRITLDDALADFELTSREYGVLSVFETRGELSTSELARVAQVTRQSMHPAISRLESAGLLERRARNQRVVLWRPTAKGHHVLKLATERIRAVENAAFAGLSTQDEATVRGWLAGLASPVTSDATQDGTETP